MRVGLACGALWAALIGVAFNPVQKVIGPVLPTDPTTTITEAAIVGNGGYWTYTMEDHQFTLPPSSLACESVNFEWPSGPAIFSYELHGVEWDPTGSDVALACGKVRVTFDEWVGTC